MKNGNFNFRAKLKSKFPRTPHETCNVDWPLKYLFNTVFIFAVSCLAAAVDAFEKSEVKKMT